MRKTYKKNKAKNTRKHKSVRNKRRKRNYYLTGGAQFPDGLEYWNDFFNDDEKVKLNKLRTEIQDLFRKSPEASFTDLCDIMRELVPTFYVPEPPIHVPVPVEGGPGYTIRPDGMLVSNEIPNSNKFYYFNAILCVSFKLFGIIAKKMALKDECNYKLIFKGGKAIQLVLRKISNDIINGMTTEGRAIEGSTGYALKVLKNLHQTEDIDVALIPKPERRSMANESDIKALAHNISKLIEWFFHNVSTINVSIQTPEDFGVTNKYIYKLSYKPKTSGYRAFSDINFRLDTTSDFSVLESFFVSSPDELDVLFECEKIKPLLEDKILYYTKYVYLYFNQDLLPYEKETTSEADCIRYIIKFGKAIISLNNGLHLGEAPHLDEDGLKVKTDEYLKKELELLKNDFSKINKKTPENKDEFFKQIMNIQEIIRLASNHQQRLEEQRLEKQRLEKQRLEKQRLEEQRLEDQRLEEQRLEEQRLEIDQRVQGPQHQQQYELWQQWQQQQPYQQWPYQQQQWPYQQQTQNARPSTAREHRTRQTQSARPSTAREHRTRLPPRQGLPPLPPGHGLPPLPPGHGLPPLPLPPQGPPLGQGSTRRLGSSRGRARGTSKKQS
jgi:hypothetical protein